MFEMIPIVIVVLIGVFALVAFILKGLALIHDDEVGILTKKMFGTQLPQGRIIAREGEIGVQAATVMPRLIWRNPITWKIEKFPVTEINPNEVGIVESIDGEPLPLGRLLADVVDCDSYQNAKMFLDNKGKKGPQVEILRPGTYRINTKVFKIVKQPITKIEEESIGIVVAQDGTPLPSGFIIAPKPEEMSVTTHNFYQNGQAFIENKGFRGPQLDTLQPGEYYVNPLLFQVTQYEIADVPPGYVAVLRSNIGEELVHDTKLPEDSSKEPDFKQQIHETEEVILSTDMNKRGIWRDPIAPGKYNLNKLAFSAYLVPTSAVTIDWATGSEIRAEHRIEGSLQEISGMSSSKTVLSEEVSSDKAREFFKFNQLRVTSRDGFQLDVDVRMIIRIRPQNAPFVIARFGSVANLIEQIVHPLIDSSFRNKAGEEKAIDFVMRRTDLQKEALEKAREEFEKYHVEAQNLLIAYISLDKTLLETQTNKEIAIQQQTQYEQQALAQEKRIAVKEKEARAEKQAEVIAAKLSIDIETDKAESVRRAAAGIRDSTKMKADGDGYQNQTVGEGIAKGYKAQTDVIGMYNLTLIQALKEISAGEIKITPDTYVVSGGSDASNGLLTTWLVNMIKQTSQEKQPVKENKK